MWYMNAPLKLTERQMLIYFYLYKKCDFDNMEVKVTTSQIVTISPEAIVSLHSENADHSTPSIFTVPRQNSFMSVVTRAFFPINASILVENFGVSNFFLTKGLKNIIAKIETIVKTKICSHM